MISSIREIIALRHSPMWGFSREKEQDYLAFVAKGNLLMLRLINWLNLTGYSIFIIVDLGREVDHPVMLIVRMTMVIFSAALIFISFRMKFTGAQTEWLLITTFLGYLIISVTLTQVAELPFYSLPNLFINLIVITLISGLRLTQSLLLISLYLIVYLIITFFFDSNPFYNSQIPHLISTSIFAAVITGVLEARRRGKYLRYITLLFQNKKVDELNRQKTRIIAVLSHDVQSPINSLKGLLSLSNKGVLSENELKGLLHDIQHRLGNVSTMVEGLVKWAKVQAIGFEARIEEFTIQEVIQENKDIFAPIAANKGVTILPQIRANLMVSGDIDIIHMAIRNVLANAVKFANHNSTIDIITTSDFDRVSIDITNSGGGISQEQQEIILSYNIHPTHGSAGEKGTGLGLAMSKELLVSCGGDLYLKDGSAESTTFCITLRLAGTSEGS